MFETPTLKIADAQKERKRKSFEGKTGEGKGGLIVAPWHTVPEV